MTPIPAVVTVNASETTEEALQRSVSSGHTRLIVIEDDNPDRVRGIVHNNSLVRLYMNAGGDASIEPAIRDAPIFPETKPLDDLLTELQRQRSSIAVVSDEYGRTVGIVTVEDILEEVVGEIEDETDPRAASLRQAAPTATGTFAATYRWVTSRTRGSGCRSPPTPSTRSAATSSPSSAASRSGATGSPPTATRSESSRCGRTGSWRCGYTGRRPASFPANPGPASHRRGTRGIDDRVVHGTHPSQLLVDGYDFSTSNPDSYYTVGHVESPSSKCVAHRTVKVFYGYQTESDYRLVDVATTGQSGAFGAEGPVFHDGNSVTALKLKLVETKVGSRHHRQICEGDKSTL